MADLSIGLLDSFPADSHFIKDPSRIEIVYCGDALMFDGVLSSVISILRRTARPVVIHLITMSVKSSNSWRPFNADQADFIRDVIREKSPDSSFVLHDLSDEFQHLFSECPNLGTFYTPYSLLRLFLDVAFPQSNKLIYLDADVMASGDIAELFDQDVEDVEYAGVLDRYGSKFLHHDYVNSGVLLVNMKVCRRSGLFERARRIALTTKLAFPDQDALYRATTSKRLLPRRFNEQKHFEQECNVLCHFTRRLRLTPYPHRENWKQWHIDKLHDRLKCFSFDDDLAEYKVLKKRFEDEYGQGFALTSGQSDTAITLSHVGKIYHAGGAETRALEDVSLEIPVGTLTVVLGSSGSGKSTLLNMMGGLDVPTTGTVTVDGMKVDQLSRNQRSRFRRDHVGFVFQSYSLVQDLTAWENVELAHGMTRCSMTSIEALAAVGLQGKRDSYPSQLSGGEQQRVSIARAIVKASGVLLCDEPTGALDFETGIQILKTIDALRNAKGRTIVIVTHDADIARIADLVVTMRSGRIADIRVNTNPLTVDEAMR